MNFATHPRQIQRYRDEKLPTAGLMSFRCKKLAGGGWRCAECAK